MRGGSAPVLSRRHEPIDRATQTFVQHPLRFPAERVLAKRVVDDPIERAGRRFRASLDY